MIASRSIVYTFQKQIKVNGPKEFTNGEAAKIGYNLPVRTVFEMLHNGEMAQKIVEELNK
jgi:hypothetical protein